MTYSPWFARTYPANLSDFAGRLIMALRENTALLLREMRLERGLSQEGLAKASGIDRTFISGVERNRRNITLDTLDRLLAALGVDSHRFLCLLADREKTKGSR
ncbi:helix-turn-helix domain-containing protein [Photobacterium gaetbulicola]|uniref:helix-turn-helix domain-containing protein n=1 Tax=Photobacterium gaetbulicola TaxID=1295392 RepID=UPI002012C863|nr:helix-turn-helix transcriptional regulator [Photobacterium gaetbulicola]